MGWAKYINSVAVKCISLFVFPAHDNHPSVPNFLPVPSYHNCTAFSWAKFCGTCTNLRRLSVQSACFPASLFRICSFSQRQRQDLSCRSCPLKMFCCCFLYFFSNVAATCVKSSRIGRCCGHTLSHRPHLIQSLAFP